VKVATKALRGPPRLDGFEAFSTAWMVGADGCGENLVLGTAHPGVYRRTWQNGS
jgi:hypothetical protein